MNWLLPLIIGLAAGAALTWFLTRRQQRESLEMVRQQINEANSQSLEVLQEQLSSKDAEIRTLRGLYDAERGSHIDAKAKLEEAQRRLSEQQTFIENIQQQMKDSFASLSQDVLRKVLDDAKGDIGQKQQAIDTLLKPLSEALKRYEEQARNLETNLKRDYGSLEEHLRQVGDSTSKLQKETYNLGQALRTPQVKGRWGEMTLRRLVELAGMTQHCDFVEQFSVETEEGRQRPDLIVHVPGGGQIVVDSKVPLNAYLDAVAAESEQDRTRHLARHAAQVKAHLRGLSTKAYWNQFEKTPDWVVMFIAGEAFFSAALEADRDLVEEALTSRVILASPMTLMALLGTAARGWRLEQFAENAEQIRSLGAELYERIAKFIESFTGVGRALEQAVASYDKAVGSLEKRVLVSARKFRELGATSQPEIADVEPLDRVPRVVQSDLLTTPSYDEN